MRSVRLAPELEARLSKAAAARGESVSEFIRRAAAERAEATLGSAPSTDFTDVLGVVHAGGGRARRTGERYAEDLAERRPRA